VAKGVAGGAARLNRPILVADVSKNAEYLPNPLLPETKTELAVPIATGDQVLGVLDVQHNVIGSLSQTDADMLRSIASQVAIALINARSYAETQRRADREGLINEINRKILGTTSIEQAMQVAVRELGKALGSRQAHIYLDTKWAKNGHS
jgi:GAF domain-containing protein